MLRTSTLDWYTPRAIAEATRSQLAGNHSVRFDYPFAVPRGEDVEERQVDSAVFTSPLPSINSARIGFVDARHNPEIDLADFAYLGAPRLVVLRHEHVDVHHVRGGTTTMVQQQLPVPSSESELWIRELVAQTGYDAQPGIFTDRELLLADTRVRLTRLVERIMRIGAEEAGVAQGDAFHLAIRVVRQLVLGEPWDAVHRSPGLTALFEDLVSSLSGRLSFSNIPPDSIAEMYEALAVTETARRREGIVYTPAWLARYAVDQLPPGSFKRGMALDPTCGSGTFLVAFLERFSEERFQGEPEGPSSEELADKVAGMDVDPVAIEAARLALDFLAASLGVSRPVWNLRVGDATQTSLQGQWLIGNFPFGYRTYDKRRDISSVILERQQTDNRQLEAMSVIMPDSLAYAHATSATRKMLRENFRILQVSRLPEAVFTTSSARTLLVVARKGSPKDSLLVREVEDKNLSSFRSGVYASRSYTARLPKLMEEPWRFSPFSNEFERAERLGMPLRDIADAHFGLQVYGYETAALAPGSTRQGRPLLQDPRDFRNGHPIDVFGLEKLTAARDGVRRPGPWDKFDDEKIIVRATTPPENAHRLAALPDSKGVWFTDKFAGIWANQRVPILGLAAYLQTRFVRVWFAVNNPSRKLRIGTLKALPIPKLSSDWWERASGLADWDQVVTATDALEPYETSVSPTNSELVREWEWFNAVVESAFSFDPTVGQSLDDWLRSNSR